jgi:hypothetical protein
MVVCSNAFIDEVSGDFRRAAAKPSRPKRKQQLRSFYYSSRASRGAQRQPEGQDEAHDQDEAHHGAGRRPCEFDTHDVAAVTIKDVELPGIGTPAE